MTSQPDEHYDYTPVMPEELWRRIRPLVRQIVQRASPATAYTEKQLYPVTAKLVGWAVDTAALPLDVDILFDSGTIDEFAHAGLVAYTSSGRATMRSKLRAIARALGDGNAGQVPLRRSDPLAPYRPMEVAALESWARGQHSSNRRSSAGALLALGLGAGLTGREIVAAKAADVAVTDNGVIVEVRGAQARQVPVLAEWEALLQVRLSSTDGWLFRDGQEGGNPNLVSDFVSRSHQRLTVQARRLRSTWIVHHLTVGTPLPVLLDAAGLQSAEALDRLLPFVPTRGRADVTRILRGTAPAP